MKRLNYVPNQLHLKKECDGDSNLRSMLTQRKIDDEKGKSLLNQSHAKKSALEIQLTSYVDAEKIDSKKEQN